MTNTKIEVLERGSSLFISYLSYTDISQLTWQDLSERRERSLWRGVWEEEVTWSIHNLSLKFRLQESVSKSHWDALASKILTFHCRFRLFLLLLISLGASGGSGSQPGVVKLTTSDTILCCASLMVVTLKG